jgi:hypothetical protein
MANEIVQAEVGTRPKVDLFAVFTVVLVIQRIDIQTLQFSRSTLSFSVTPPTMHKTGFDTFVPMTKVNAPNILSCAGYKKRLVGARRGCSASVLSSRECQRTKAI